MPRANSGFKFGAKQHKGRKRYFNVIFHGPFIFVSYPNRLEALCGDIEEHVVGIGTWQEERPCVPGMIDISGFLGAKAMDPIDKRSIVCIPSSAAGDLPNNAYYHFVMPSPKSIRALGVVAPEPGNFDPLFVGSYAKNIKNRKFGSAHAVTFEIGYDDTPHVENVDWEPIPNGLNAINLHIFNESPFLMDRFHPNRDFELMVRMLPQLDLGISRPFPDINFFTVGASNIGISEAEEGGLRGLPPVPLHRKHKPGELSPPRICDAPSLLVTGAV